eukprot:5139508-Prymnesium_polylepis.1
MGVRRRAGTRPRSERAQAACRAQVDRTPCVRRRTLCALARGSRAAGRGARGHRRLQAPRAAWVGDLAGSR